MPAGRTRAGHTRAPAEAAAHIAEEWPGAVPRVGAPVPVDPGVAAPPEVAVDPLVAALRAAAPDRAPVDRRARWGRARCGSRRTGWRRPRSARRSTDRSSWGALSGVGCPGKPNRDQASRHAGSAPFLTPFEKRSHAPRRFRFRRKGHRLARPGDWFVRGASDRSSSGTCGTPCCFRDPTRRSTGLEVPPDHPQDHRADDGGHQDEGAGPDERMAVRVAETSLRYAIARRPQHRGAMKDEPQTTQPAHDQPECGHGICPVKPSHGAAYGPVAPPGPHRGAHLPSSMT
jgi:hypothetical protein